MTYQYHFHNFTHYERFLKDFISLRLKVMKKKQFPRTFLCFLGVEKLSLVQPDHTSSYLTIWQFFNLKISRR